MLAAAAGDDHLITITHDLPADAATDPRQYQREVRAWSLEDLAALLPLSHPHPVGGLRFSADGRRLATFDSRMQEMQFVPGATPRDARFTMTDAGGGSVRLWDIACGRSAASCTARNRPRSVSTSLRAAWTSAQTPAAPVHADPG